LSAELVETLGDSTGDLAGRLRAAAAELVVLAELAQSAADGNSDIGLDEIGQLLASRFVEAVSGKPRKAGSLAARDRRRAVETALWIGCPFAPADRPGRRRRSGRHQPVPFPAAILGQRLASPAHQYLVRSRLRHAARRWPTTTAAGNGTG